MVSCAMAQAFPRLVEQFVRLRLIVVVAMRTVVVGGRRLVAERGADLGDGATQSHRGLGPGFFQARARGRGRRPAGPSAAWPRRRAINGFGRIGRNVLRAIVESGRTDIEVVAINDLGPSRPTPTCCATIRSTAVPGTTSRSKATRSRRQGKPIKVTAIKDPATCRTRNSASTSRWNAPASSPPATRPPLHLTAGAKRVIVSAPADGADLTVVFGVNHDS
jgi:hypothetical protein